MRWIFHVLWAGTLSACAPAPHAWTAREAALIASMALSRLPSPPPDPSNAVADDPRAAELGRLLFFDAGLSREGDTSCATCHHPELGFTDGRPLPVGAGPGARHTPTVIGTAYNAWFFWDGRRDSAWAQALEPLEDEDEQGASRVDLARHVVERHADAWEPIFGPLPDLSDPARFPPSAGPRGDEAARAAWEAMDPRDQETVNRVFASIGKVIAAYERQLLDGPTRFDAYADAVAGGDDALATRIFSASEARGLRLFLGPARCVDCHHGPRLTNGDFHDDRLPPPEDGPIDLGRAAGVLLALQDPFRCDGPYGDAGPDGCQEPRFARTEGPDLIAAMKVPSLRGVGLRAPYMHRGQLADLAAVIAHYDAPEGPAYAASLLHPLGLDDQDRADLEAFLRTLDGGGSPERYATTP